MIVQRIQMISQREKCRETWVGESAMEMGCIAFLANGKFIPVFLFVDLQVLSCHGMTRSGLRCRDQTDRQTDRGVF